MYQIFSYSNCLHISENKDSVIIAIDKPSEVYEWLETIKEGNYGDLFTAFVMRRTKQQQRNNTLFVAVINAY